MTQANDGSDIVDVVWTAAVHYLVPKAKYIGCRNIEVTRPAIEGEAGKLCNKPTDVFKAVGRNRFGMQACTQGQPRHWRGLGGHSGDSPKGEGGVDHEGKAHV